MPLRRQIVTSILASLLATSVLAETPRAVVTGPKTVPVGSIVFLDASLSVSDRPLKWRILGNPTPLIALDKDGQKGVYAILPTLEAGTHRVAVIAIGTPKDAKEPDADIGIIEFTVGSPKPVDPVKPVDPDIKPVDPVKPIPTDKFGRLGNEYAKVIVDTYADTFDESASMIAAGVSKTSVDKDFDQRWRNRRTAAFASIAKEFATIAPDGREPNADERARLAQAWKDFARGLKSR